MKKSILKISFIFVAVFLLSAMLMVAATAEIITGDCGADGDNVTYTLDTETGVLEVDGEGKMANYAFQTNVPWYSYRNQIKSVEFSNQITSVGNRVFYDCPALTHVSLPDSVQSIGTSSFRNCVALSEISIGSGVVSIGESAFEDCSSLQSITIPKSVTAVGYRAFYDCVSLSTVKIGTGVKEIGTYAFYNCESLKSIVIPDNVTSIGVYVFQYCKNLKDVVIGNGIDVINTSAFDNCSSLSNLTIGTRVTKIGQGAFASCSSLRVVQIPNNVVSIGDSAFRWCTALTRITIGDSVTSIGDYAFFDCSNLESVSIPDSVITIGKSVFEDCKALSTVKIGTGVKEIGTYAFESCESLKSIVIPDNVTSLGMEVFRYCDNLSYIIFGNGLSSIGKNVIYSCDGFNTIYLHKDSYADEYFKNTSYRVIYITNTSDVSIVDISPSYGLSVSQYTIRVVDEDNFAIAAATVKWGAKEIVTDAFGDAQFSYPGSAPQRLLIVADGYVTVDIEDYKTTEQSALSIIEMSKNDGTSRIIPLTCNGELISTSFVRINNRADLNATIKVKGYSHKKIIKYQLRQGDNVLCESQNGEFELHNSKFAAQKPIDVYMYTDDGSFVSETLNISVTSFSCNGLFFDGSPTTITVPDDVPILKGLSFKIDISETIDFKLDISNNGFALGFNMDVYKKDLSTLNKGLREWKDKNKHWVKSKDITLNIGGYVLVDVEDDMSYEIYSEVVMSVAYKGIASKTFVWVVPIRVELEFETEFELAIKGIEYLVSEGKIVCPQVNGTMSIGVLGRAGIGCYLASAGIYGSAALNFETQIFPFNNFYVHLNKVFFTGEFGFYAKVKWIGETKVKIVDGELIVYDSNRAEARSLTKSIDVYDASLYTVPSRTYLSKMTGWNASSEGVLQSGVCDGSDPQIVDAGDVRVMVFIADNGGDDHNYNQLRYSVYSDGVWSSPTTLDKNDFSDVDFDLYSDGENVWVVYTQAKRVLTSEDKAEDKASTLEVIVATFDTAMGAFGTPVTITSNNTMDSNAKIAVVNGTPVIVWVNNADNNVFGMTANNTIYMSQYKSGKWSSPIVLATNVPAVIGIDVGSLNSELCLAAIHDNDSDFNTTGDGILRVYKADGTSYSYESGSYESVTFEDGELYWYKDFSIYTADKFGGAGELVSDSLTANSAADFEIIDYNGCKYILYRVYNTEGENGGSDLYAIVNSGTGWSAPVRLTNTEGYIDSFDVLALDGSLMTVYRRTDVSFAGGEMTTSCELCSDILELSVSLDIQEITYDYEDIFGDDSVTLKVIIINKGADIANGFTVAVGSATKSFDTILAPGATAEVEILCDLSETETAEVIVTDENKISVSKDADVHHFDFETNVECKVIGGSKYINVTVRNNGNIEGAGTLYIRRDSKDGKVIYSEEMVLADGNQKYILLEIVDETLKDVYIEFVVSDGTDYFDGNNSNFTSIPEDIAISYGDLNGDTEVNAIDAVMLAQKIAGWDVELDETAADCNGDGEVNAIDAVLLAQFIAGWDVVLG